MSEQMTEDWIEQEYDKWEKKIAFTFRDKQEIKRAQYIARHFAFYILKKSASFTSKENLTQDNSKNLNVQGKDAN